MRNQAPRPYFVTFMQHGRRKGLSKAISRRLGVEPLREEGMVRRVNGRFPVADGLEASLPGQTANIRVNREEGADHLRFWVRKRATDSRVRGKPTPIMLTGGQK